MLEYRIAKLQVGRACRYIHLRIRWIRFGSIISQIQASL